MMTPEMQTVIKDLLLNLFQLAVLVATYYAARWVRAKISAEQMELAASIVNVVVGAVEQLAAAGKIDYQSKFDEALKRAKAQAAKWGLTLGDEEWEDLIEAAVKALKDAGEEIKRAPAT